MKKPAFLFVALFSGIAASQLTWAGPADYVYTTNVDYGERELDIKLGAATPAGGTRAQAITIGLGYGMKEYWFTEAYLKQERIGGKNFTLVEWENKFKFTETGKYPVDVGLITELAAPLAGNGPWELRVGPLLQTEFGKLQLNSNLLFERAFGKADESGVPFTTNIGYQLQAKYRLQRTFEFGVQALGEMGTWNHWSKQVDQNHRIGPAIFGKFALGNQQAIKYNAAWLIGTTRVAPKHTLRVQIEHEF